MPPTVKEIFSQKTAIKMIDKGTIKGGMVPKIRECIKAVVNNVKRVHILNGFEKNSLLSEVFTRKGNGTMILNDQEIEEYESTGF